MQINIAASPGSWGATHLPEELKPEWQELLDRMAEYGYAGTELGKLGYLPTAPSDLAEALSSRKLALIAGWTNGALSDESARADLEAEAKQTCDLVSAVGGRYLVLMDTMNGGRIESAGRSEQAQRVDDSSFAVLIESITRLSDIAQASGLQALVHPHFGSYIEFEDEVERVLAALPDHVGLCLDTGHSHFAGFDPAEFLRRHADRVGYLHFVDMHPQLMPRVHSGELGLIDAIMAGLMCTLGEGTVNFAAVRDALDESGYDGWATVETYVGEQRAQNDEAAHRSRDFLRDVGLCP